MKREITIRPADGGRLLCDVSNHTAGLANYTIKRDVRRDLEGEMRAEGYTVFEAPGARETEVVDPTSGNAIRLIAEVRRANGQVAIICGTKTTLYRYVGLDSGKYFTDGYVTTGYIAEQPDAWTVIGSGFSSSGKRWEAVDINGYLVLNNAVDLPMTYRVEESTVKPIYELREQGVASVGTIAEHNGVLVCGDLKVIKEQYLEHVLGKPAPKKMLTADPDGGAPGYFWEYSGLIPEAAYRFDWGRTVVVHDETCVAPASGVVVGSPSLNDLGAEVIRADMAYPRLDLITDGIPVIALDTTQLEEGKRYWFTPGENEAALIVDETNETLGSSGGAFTMGPRVRIFAPDLSYAGLPCTASIKAVLVEDELCYANPYGVLPDELVERYQWRETYSLPENPRRFGAPIPCTVNYASNVLGLAYAAKSVEPGMSVMILAAGPLGTNLTVEIVAVRGRKAIVADYAITNMVLAARIAGTPITATELDTVFMAAEAVDSMAGRFEDLIGDGTAIVKQLSLGDVLVVYKERQIFLGRYVGTAAKAFDFGKPIQVPDGMGVYFRHTVIDAGSFHFYASRKGFCRFDLVSRIPTELELFQPCQGLLYNYIEGLDPEDVFAANNPLTKEVFFCFPNVAGTDKALRWDYRWGTLSTTGAAYTAAAPVQLSGKDYFLLGSSAGQVFSYGGFNRNGAEYDSVLQSGMEAFGSLDSEKLLTKYVLFLDSASAEATIEVVFRGATNPSDAADVITASLTAPKTRNMLKPTLRRYLLGNRLTIRGKDNPVKLNSQLFTVEGVKTQSFGRRQK